MNYKSIQPTKVGIKSYSIAVENVFHLYTDITIQLCLSEHIVAKAGIASYLFSCFHCYPYSSMCMECYVHVISFL